MQESGNENNGALPWIFKSDDEVLPLSQETQDFLSQLSNLSRTAVGINAKGADGADGVENAFNVCACASQVFPRFLSVRGV